jgi:hypothetical protein
VVDPTDTVHRTWQAAGVRYSEFWDLVDDVLGPLGRTITRDQVIGALGDRTSEEALASGDEPIVVWRALCDARDVPVALRWGHDRARKTR